MAMKLGYHVIFNPTRGINRALPIPAGVEVGPSMESDEEIGDSDYLVFYANDAVYKMNQRKERWQKLFRDSGKAVVVLNFVMGEVWAPHFSDHIEKFLFLNKGKEIEVVERFREKGIEQKPTFSMPPPVDLNPFLKLEEPDYSRIDFARTGRYNGKYNEKDYLEIIEGWQRITPGSHYYFMATPPFLKNKFSEDERFHLLRWNEVSIPEILTKASLFHYRLPKKMRDQGPRVIVEAMARGLPVIAEPRDGALDRVTDETGWLVSDNEGFVKVVKDILDNPGILEQKGKAARERAITEFNPWNWMAHITGKTIPAELAGREIVPPSDEELFERQEKEFPRTTSKVSVPKPVEELDFSQYYDKNTEGPEMHFGEGNLRSQEWSCIKHYLEMNGCRRVVDICGSYSSFLLNKDGYEVLALDSRDDILSFLSKMGVRTMRFDYPRLPEIKEAFDVAIVSGRTQDGRKAALEYLADKTNTIFLRDSTRPLERKAAETTLSEEEWDRLPLAMGLCLFERK